MRLLYVFIVSTCVCICGIVYCFLPYIALNKWASLMQVSNISVISKYTKSQPAVTDDEAIDESKYLEAYHLGHNDTMSLQPNVLQNASSDTNPELLQHTNSTTRKPGIATKINETYALKDGGSTEYRLPSTGESSRLGLNNDKTCQVLKDDITIVTAFFYLGHRFPKGAGYRASDVYFKWITIFRHINNPVVAYFGREEDRDLFLKLRPKSSRLKTRTEILVTDNMWAFQIKGKLRRKLNSSNEDLDRLRDYNCIQHAKYELLLRTANENPYCTRYIQWLDIGLFRSLVEKNETEPFSMWLPEDYNNSCVAYSGVRQRSPARDPRDIIINGGCWLVGATALANITLMKIWARGYMNYTEEVIDKYDVIVSDQGILYSWMNARQNVLPVQEYRSRIPDEQWFALGYRCRDAGQMRNTRRESDA